MVERDCGGGGGGSEINQKGRITVIFEYFRPKRVLERWREGSGTKKEANC